MPGQSLTTDAIVLLKREPAESFQSLIGFSSEHGIVTVLQRIAKKASSQSASLDLFDEASLVLESSNQGQTWFLKEARLIHRPTGIARSYDTLRFASALASLVARSPVADESRASLYALLRQAFAAFASADRPDVVYLKSLYVFARDEGHPLKQHWFPTLPSSDRTALADVLNKPVAEVAVPQDLVARLQRRLEEYLRGHTEMMPD